MSGGAVYVRYSSEFLSINGGRMRFEFDVAGNPVPKPRQTRRDKWMQRKCVVACRNWADAVRIQAQRVGVWPKEIDSGVLTVDAYLPFPKSYTQRQRDRLRGQPHLSKPDADNLLKAVMDALFTRGDEVLWSVRCNKRWDDGGGPRVRVALDVEYRSACP